MSNVLQLREVTKSFPQPVGVLELLRGVSLEIAAGEVVALVGASGSGKTTLLQIAGLLAMADSGAVFLQGHDVAGLSEKERTALRASSLGFVYQFHHLLPEFTALENVMLPQLVIGRSKEDAQQRAQALLAEFGLRERAGHRPAQLSGGEMQRVAIARALANDPPLLLADEPTGNLDDASAERVFAALMQAVKQRGMAALVVTHNLALATRMSRTVMLEHGALK